MPGLKVVALISGGKDSFFSILHCHANGHEVVALANLHPPAQDGERSEDIDSYMYQTIGHTVIPLYEQALGLPLYRQEILGGAVDQNKSYASPDTAQSAEQDETESLVPLLRKVMAEHPEVNAVSTGAILSDYQRTRVESVAIRLGLVPLSYLWQYPFLPPYAETSLLDDMAAAGQDARIIKVASGGLDDGFLWENVASFRTKTRLVRAMERFGIIGDGAALGEGGEFETLAVDGPWPLWKNSIQIEDEDRLVVTGEAGAASLKIKTASLVPKEPSSDFSYEQLRKPTTLDDKFSTLDSRIDDTTEQTSTSDELVEKTKALSTTSGWTIQKTDTSTIISNAMAEGATAGEQMTNIMTRLTKDHNINPSSIAFTTILLRDMSTFGSVNQAYGSHFTTPNPPARVTIACGNSLPTNTHVSLSAIILNDEVASQKQGLHVQSRSYWAPANIGPYSQAIVMPSSASFQALPQKIHIAGQIPLHAPTMEFPAQGDMSPARHFTAQAILALQHLWRIGQIMHVSSFLGAVAFISASSPVSTSSRVDTAIKAWTLVHERPAVDDQDEDEESADIDLWDRVHGQQFGNGSAASTSTQRNDIGARGQGVPPCFVAEVESLPRDAPVEWASTGVRYDGHVQVKGTLPTSIFSYAEQNTNGDAEVVEDVCTRQILNVKSGLDEVVIAGWIALNSVDVLEKVEVPASCVCTVYTTQNLPEAWVKERQPTIVPCYRLWNGQGQRVAAIVAYRQQ
ncbi:adenine nucleotide alpha hydrolases-like protein [Aureobasidium pullulans]|uniref:Diphthine--ammonia ligase n=1 Tax=Aureobasidium pullulans TaxID=5580 RepID=A0A4V4JV91_AURPU|nr:adenine nucleotide alpha hydrolases-like protein [Aureobasidium pullulans]